MNNIGTKEFSLQLQIREIWALSAATVNLSQARQRQFIFSRIGFLSTNIFAKVRLFSKQAIDITTRPP